MAGMGLRERNRRAAMAEVQRAAVQMMRESGFDHVTVEQIATVAGVSPSTMYRYFGTKEALVLWGDRSERLVTVLAEDTTAHASSSEAFVAAATAVYADDVADLLGQLRLVNANEALAVAFEHQVLGRRRAIAAVFAERRGAASVGLRDASCAAAHLGMLVAVLERWQAGEGAKSLAKMLAKAAASLDG